MFQFAERLSERGAFVASQLELARDLDLVEWPVIALSEERENLRFNVTSGLSHVSETILLCVIVDITRFSRRSNDDENGHCWYERDFPCDDHLICCHRSKDQDYKFCFSSGRNHSFQVYM